MSQKVHYLKDYQPPAYHIDKAKLCFRLDAERTLVTSRYWVKNLIPGTPLILDGEDLELVEVKVNEKIFTDYEQTQESLILQSFEGSVVIEITTAIYPNKNTALEGLYVSGSHLVTQCESHGFRKITYFLDRPDNLTRFVSVHLIARKADYPVLLSNGNLIRTQDLEEGYHEAIWQDPFPKPSYLFALVAGKLEKNSQRFITGQGQEVLLEVYTEKENLYKTPFALEALQRAMRWDEQRYGCYYDLDRFMLVAVNDFNAGAMENKGLNIFNAKYALADPQTATDQDFVHVDAVIAHEYFHNWTGNRVTVRDWFQLTLKEGLTVFRDQSYTEETFMGAVKRIEDVAYLRAHQFPEDAGPLAHPIQPQSYVEMNNFYTLTVYEKGAEVVRLYHSLLGE